MAGGHSTVHIRTDSNAVVAYGYNYVTNRGSQPVTSVTADLVPLPDRDYSGVTVQDVKVVETEAENLAGLGAGWWPFEELAEAARPLASYTFEPDRRVVELLFIVKVTGTGRWLWPATRIEYEVDGEKHAQEISNGFLICTPASAKCEPDSN